MSVIIKLNEKKERFKNIPVTMTKEVVKKIAPQWKPNGSRDITRGLTYEQEVLAMPNLIGVQPNDPNWNFKVRDFWADFSIVPTAQGRELDISTKKVKYKDSLGAEQEIDYPVNLEDYMAWQVCLQSSMVAKTKDDMENLENFDYILIDKSEVERKEVSAFEIASKADIAFSRLVSKFTENESTIDWILELLKDKKDGHPASLSEERKQMMLREKKEKNPSVFISVVSDKDLESKALIAQLTTHNILTKEGNDYYFIDEKIGSELVMIAYLKDPVKSTAVGKMKSQLENKIRESKN